jgi:hypothetical protein
MTREVVEKVLRAVYETKQKVEFKADTGRAVFIQFWYPGAVALPGVFRFDEQGAALDETVEANQKLIEVIKAIKQVKEMPAEYVLDDINKKSLKLVEIMDKYGIELFRDAKKVITALELQERGIGVIVPVELQIKVTFNQTEEKIF